MKVLYIATITEHITAFHLPYLKWFKEQGWEVHVATYGDDSIPYCDKKYDISIQRSPFKLKNIKAYFQLKKILQNEKYDIIHGHTPMGGILTRLCGKSHRKTGTKVIYTAHGFHFYKGAPLINWLLYYPIEKWLSNYTDVLILINTEDFELAQRKMKAKKIYYIPGIGVDTDKFSKPTADRETKRKELDIPSDSAVLMSVGELNKNKNHQMILKAVSKLIELKKSGNNLYYIICGEGKLKEDLLNLCKQLKIDKYVIFLGYRTDIIDLLYISDIFVFPSFREGLSVSLMEAMAAGLPCVVSKIRGNSDLIGDGKGGFLCGVNSAEEYTRGIDKILNDKNLKNHMAGYNRIVIQKFDISVVMNQMKKIYSEIENGIQ